MPEFQGDLARKRTRRPLGRLEGLLAALHQSRQVLRPLRRMKAVPPDQHADADEHEEDDERNHRAASQEDRRGLLTLGAPVPERVERKVCTTAAAERARVSTTAHPRRASIVAATTRRAQVALVGFRRQTRGSPVVSLDRDGLEADARLVALEAVGVIAIDAAPNALGPLLEQLGAAASLEVHRVPVVTALAGVAEEGARSRRGRRRGA
mmetsp:Transcript_24618/g.97687  ORF Transcript_24618/g.97687 Transcript_24618/m.97687 type:complete len:209 (+) Transcript_24618:1584-2210(+)